jgi:hypothetical protein
VQDPDLGRGHLHALRHQSGAVVHLEGDVDRQHVSPEEHRDRQGADREEMRRQRAVDQQKPAHQRREATLRQRAMGVIVASM